MKAGCRNCKARKVKVCVSNFLSPLVRGDGCLLSIGFPGYELVNAAISSRLALRLVLRRALRICCRAVSIQSRPYSFYPHGHLSDMDGSQSIVLMRFLLIS
jgi:hypothetical protein